MVGKVKLTELTTAAIRAWHHEVAEHCGAYTANRAASLLRSILALAEEDFGIDKEFPVHEQVKIRFGSLFQNAFNRVNWRVLNTDINNDASFGKYQDSFPGRNIQFYLRVEF